MKKPAYTFSEARDAFLKALTDYQTATRNKTSALERVSRHTHKFYVSFNDIAQISGAMTKPRS